MNDLLRAYLRFDVAADQFSLHQAKELAIGGASHLFKHSRTAGCNRSRPQGKTYKPDISTWQALAKVLHSAFIRTILPRFDRTVRPNATANPPE